MGIRPLPEDSRFDFGFGYNVVCWEVHMKRIYLALICGFLGMTLIGAAIPPQVHGQAEISKINLVNALRLLNTQEYTYQHDNGRFATQQEMLNFLRTKRILSQSPIDLENPKPYELTITTSPDGKHYQITLKRLADSNDKNAACSHAAFSDDGGLIILAQLSTANRQVDRFICF